MPEDIEFDVNRVVAEFMTQNMDRLFETGKDFFKGATDRVRLKLKSSYSDYLTCVANRYSKTKSFFIRNEPIDLYSFYVPLSISHGGGYPTMPCEEILSHSSQSAFVVEGSAGVGKSMMLRHLFLESITAKKKVPLFLEIRSIEPSISLIDQIKQTLHKNNFTLDNDFIDLALKKGDFLILIDGFDEINSSYRSSIGRQIQDLAQDFDRNVIIVTSRPDYLFSVWNTFSVYEVSPLSLDQATELVTKLPFDDSLKDKFINDLHSDLFYKHRSFLSNPLLLSIMLLTYSQSADIPGKITIFYYQAYEALFQRHDAFKGGFQRDRLCSLDIKDFAKVFAAFSIQIYDDRRFQLTRVLTLEYLEKAKNLVECDYNINNYLADVLLAVCLLLEDGSFIIFAHRSFQEYFAACFIADAKPTLQRKLMDKYSKYLGQDNVMNLLYEMKSELVETHFILPAIEKLEQFIGLEGTLEKEHYVRLLHYEVGFISVKQTQIRVNDVKTTGHSFFKTIQFIFSCCYHLIEIEDHDVPFWKLSSITNKGESYNKVSRESIIPIDGFIKKDHLFNIFSEARHLYSMYSLERVLKIKQALIEKKENADQSLNDIFGI